jgi:hypothetical protein
MSKSVYSHEPDVPGYREDVDFFSWQQKCKQTLLEILRDMRFRNMAHKPNTACYRSGETGVVQVWDVNWKLHVQCVLHGDKEKVFYERNGISPDDMVVSLDVEADGTDKKRKKCGYTHLEIRELNQLRRTVLQGISQVAASELGEIARVEEKPTEHLVWESMAFSPDSDENVDRVALRMKTYVEKLLPAATDAMDAWAKEYGFEV